MYNIKSLLCLFHSITEKQRTGYSVLPKEKTARNFQIGRRGEISFDRYKGNIQS